MAALTDAQLLDRIARLKETNPDNLALASFELSYYDSLPAAEQQDFLRCVRSGVEIPDSSIGCYACQPNDYARFKPFFSKVVAKHHNLAGSAAHVSDWDLHNVDGLPDNAVLCLSELGVRSSLSIRVRVARNLQKFPLSAAMTKEQRCELENFILTAIEGLIAMPEYGGRYCSLTPGHANFISDAEYQKLVRTRIAFNDLSATDYNVSSGIAADWPHGRGVYISANKGLVVWIGTEDHIKVVVRNTGTVLNHAFDTLKSALSVIDAFDGFDYVSSNDFGMITSCPTNLGTGMRASVLLRLPYLTTTDDGGFSDFAAKEICGPLGVSVCGIAQGLSIGSDGFMQIFPTGRFGVTEAQIIGRLYTAIKELQRREDEARDLKREAERAEQDRGTDAQSTSKFGAWMANKVPVSATWKHRNFSARVFGILVGVIIPFLIATPGLHMLASPDYFRGTAPSARLLIGRMLAYNSTDLFLLYGTQFEPNSTMPPESTKLADIGSMTVEQLGSLRHYMESRMEEYCWDPTTWRTACHPADGQPAEGPLSMAFAWPDSIDPDDLAEFEQKVGRNETAEIPEQDGIFRLHFKNNPWAVVIGCIMFSFLYQLWFSVFLNGALDQQLQRIANAVDDVTDSLLEVAPFVTATRMDAAARTKKAQRLAKLIGMVVSLALGMLSVLVLMMAIEGNQFGIKVMEGGQVVDRTRAELISSSNSLGGCKWVPNNAYSYGEELVGDATSPKECVELVQETYPEAAIANMPVHGSGRCYAHFPELMCNSCQYANDGECDDGRHGGGAYCPEGTDEQDCIADEPDCTWVEDGECDETAHCPAGSDTVDCCDENGVKVVTSGPHAGQPVSLNAQCPDPSRPVVAHVYIDPCLPKLLNGNLIADESQEDGGWQSCLLSTIIDCDDENSHCPQVSRKFDFGRLGRGFTSFCLGLLVGGGLLGAAWGHKFVPVDKKDKNDYPLGKYRTWPIWGFLIVGIPYGLLTLTWAESLHSAQDHVMNSALGADGTGILARDNIEDAGWFAVQFAKLYRERNGTFRQEMVQTFAVAVISVMWDVMVLTFHILTPPHPKHRLRTDRRLSIYTHISSGCCEIICSVLSFVYYDEGLSNSHFRMRLTYMTVCASSPNTSAWPDTHAITGMFQTPQVFGMQCVMIPAYSVVVWWKVVCATRVALDPESLAKLIELFFIHHIYVWCRAFVFIFEGIGIFEESTYTIAIMFAGFICGPLTIGPAGNLLVVGVVASYCFCTLPFKENPEEGKLERRLNMFLNGKWRHHIEKLQGVANFNSMATKDGVAGSQKGSATVSAPVTLQSVKPIQKDGSTVIVGARVTEVLVKPGQLIKPGAPLVIIQDRPAEAPGENTVTARTIFDALDTDRSGRLECEEIVAVLVSWGVQRLEAELVVASIRSKRLTAEDRARNFVYWEHPTTGELEFKEEWEPIWRYQTSNINEAIAKYRRFASNDADREANTGAQGKAEDQAAAATTTDSRQDTVEESEYEKKARLGRLAASGKLSDELGGMSYEEAADLQLAFRPSDPDALKVQDIRDLLYNHLGVECLPGFPSVSGFLKAKDGDPFKFTLPGWLGLCDLALYVVSLPFVFVGMFQVGGQEYEWACYMGICMLPHYFNDLCCFQTNVVALLLHQIETKIMLAYNLAFCVVMTSSIMTDPADKRWLLIWTAVFPGFLVVTFQDACTFQARTTLGILNLMLLAVALPVLLAFCISLQLNIDGSLACKALGDGTLDGLNGLGRAIRFPMPDVVDEAGIPTSEGAWLPYVVMMVLTMLTFILKSAYNFFFYPDEAATLQLTMTKQEVSKEWEVGLSEEERATIQALRAQKAAVQDNPLNEDSQDED